MVEVCIFAGKLAAEASRTVEHVIESIGSPLSSINGPEGMKAEVEFKSFRDQKGNERSL